MTKLTLYNTSSKKKEIFKPFRGKKVGLYTCGPTVYDYAHIGNLRSMIFYDILRRTLKYNSYKIRQVMNITDIEDKIIRKAKQEKKKESEITKKFTKIFFDDIGKLNIEKAEAYPRATDNIKEIISLIGKLLKKGYAYQGDDKSVYFDINKFKKYGALSDLKKREIKIGARISSDEYDKKQAQDFVLWKARKQGEPFWKSPWGEGRPGWNIECSAMSIKYLGSPIDIHAGGVDLIFPHHENEIAQSEAATGKKFVRYWVHGEHILVNAKKMSKSLGNFYILRDLDKKGFNPLVFRYLVLTTHYRSKLNFTWKSLNAAKEALNNLLGKISEIENKTLGTTMHSSKQKDYFDLYKQKFLEYINDDLNAPKALSLIWKVLKDTKLSPTAKKQLVLDFDKVFGLNLKVIKPAVIPDKIKKLANRREQLRNNKQFIKADALRKEIEKLGYKIEDTKHGFKITPTRH